VWLHLLWPTFPRWFSNYELYEVIRLYPLSPVSTEAFCLWSEGSLRLTSASFTIPFLPFPPSSALLIGPLASFPSRLHYGSYRQSVRHKHRINAERHPCLEWNSKPRSVFERVKTFHALDSAATVIGYHSFYGCEHTYYDIWEFVTMVLLCFCTSSIDPFLFEIQRFGDWILSPPSGKSLLLSWVQSIEQHQHKTGCWCPEIGTSSIDWAQLSRFHLKGETDSSFRKLVCFK
jgi:hypothetical protein